MITVEDQSVSKFMVKAWTEFAKTGDPNFDTELWPQLSSSEERYLEIDATISAPVLPPEYARKTKFCLKEKPPMDGFKEVSLQA